MRNYYYKPYDHIVDNTRDYAKRKGYNHEDVVKAVEHEIARAEETIQRCKKGDSSFYYFTEPIEADRFYLNLKGICACEEKHDEQGKYYTISEAMLFVLCFA